MEKPKPASRSIQTVLESMEITMQERAKNKPKTPPPPAEIVQLPLWSEPVRGTPNAVIRGALFAAIKPSNRKALERKVIASLKGLELKFTGIQLSQTDMDVWEQALHLARQQPLGSKIEFSGHSFLKALGRKTGKSQHEQLKNSVARLMGCGLEVTIKNRYTYGGSLLEFWRDEQKNRYVIKINPKMLALFEEGWTEVDYEQRKLLRRKPLAQWLHLWLATHKNPYAMRIETYQELSGSDVKQKYHFKAALIRALDELVKIHYIRSYEIKDGLVYIKRTANDIQKIHGPKNKPANV